MKSKEPQMIKRHREVMYSSHCLALLKWCATKTRGVVQ